MKALACLGLFVGALAAAAFGPLAVLALPLFVGAIVLSGADW